MARFSDPSIPAAAFSPYLEPGEQLQHWAYGVKQPSFLLMLPLFALGVLPGVIAVTMMTKEYVVGLTDRRLIALRFKGKKIEVQEVMEYSRNNLPAVRASTGPIFTHIKILDPAKPFAAKFHRLGMPGNREHGMAMEAALTGKEAGESAKRNSSPG